MSRRQRTVPGALTRSPSAVLLGLGWASLLLVACDPDLPTYERGSLDAVRGLDENHPGWHQPDCRGCHATAVAHDGLFAAEHCALCHGGNGAVVLTDDHPGWTGAGCTACHAAPPGHDPTLPNEGCGTCHGANGSALLPPVNPTPQLTALHTGWERADCGQCHLAQSSHGGSYTITECGACHGVNGGPTRPADHWLTHCNDCHAAGPEAWNAATHTGYEALAPRACLDCHR